jgi:hypothetical protein
VRAAKANRKGRLLTICSGGVCVGAVLTVNIGPGDEDAQKCRNH